MLSGIIGDTQSHQNPRGVHDARAIDDYSTECTNSCSRGISQLGLYNKQEGIGFDPIPHLELVVETGNPKLWIVFLTLDLLSKKEMGYHLMDAIFVGKTTKQSAIYLSTAIIVMQSAGTTSCSCLNVNGSCHDYLTEAGSCQKRMSLICLKRGL
uniref:Uncharacterized protein n=1 Tax=Nelumbo nucifera TaxID=4432 RepID=A0A822XEE6_NELNU|nr:TPA_asm: hypothetical protein HUJ06_019725 [Nelumbo nucifera]